MRHSLQKAKADRGAAAVEFALVWFVLALLLLGIIQFGTIFSQWLQLGHAAREGARWASLRQPTAAVVTRAQGAAPFAGGANVTVSTNPVTAAAGTPIRVVVSRPVNSPLVSFIGTGMNLRAEATQRAE